MMNSFEKKKLANERRIKAVKEWKKQGVQNVVFQGTRKTFDSEDGHKDKKTKLFDSDDEGNEEWNFDIRPQFEGHSGQKLLEINAQLPDRFKLDERFKDDMEVEEDGTAEEEDNEKTMSFKILQSVLGRELSDPHHERTKSLRKKQLLRFDPEDENANQFIKIKEDKGEKQQKDKSRKGILKVDDEIPISTERFVEVSSNLKDILSSSSGPVTFSERFTSNDISDTAMYSKNKDDFIQESSDVLTPSDNNIQSTKFNNRNQTLNVPTFSNNFQDYFFISEDDERLKEGVEFFKRPKPMDEIREEWNQKKDRVMETFRQKKKSHLRRYSRGAKTNQRHKSFIKK